MCLVSTPDAPEPVPNRQAARQPDDGNPAVRQGDRSRRRLAMAASIFTPQNGTLGMPAVTGGKPMLGA